LFTAASAAIRPTGGNAGF